MEIYLDILFLENVVMNFLILSVTARFSKTKTSSLRLFLGTIVGALYVVVLILCPGLKMYYTTLSKIALSCLIVAVAFSISKISIFIKTLAAFYVSTFIFAGAAFAFLYFNQNGGFIKNGIVYVFWQSKWMGLLLSILTTAIIVKVFWDQLQLRTLREKLLVALKVSFESKEINMEALVDTGNSLHDPLTNTPVVIVEFMAIKDILPKEIKSIFEEEGENDLNKITAILTNSTWFSRFRLIPFTTIGKENGMLLGFKPDFIEVGVDEERKGITNVIVGIYNRALSKNEKYKALLGPELV